MMEVILLERIENLGQMGDVVNVKPGYARNYLLPQKKAQRASEENIRHFEQQRAQLEAANLDQRTEAEKVGKKMAGLQVALIRQAGDAGQLYGSVNARDIADQVTEAGFTISRQQVQLAAPIKALGLYPLRVSLHPEVSVEVLANVARSQEEAKTQSKTGRAVVSADEEEQQAAAEAAEAEVQDVEQFFEEGAAPEDLGEEDAPEEEAKPKNEAAGAGKGGDADADTGADDAVEPGESREAGAGGGKKSG